MKVSLILKGKADHFNRYPVVLRTSAGQKRTFKKTKLLLTKDEYDRFRKGEPKPSERELYKKFLACLDYKEESKPEVSFFEYCYQCLREWDNEKAPETIRQIMGELSKIKKHRTHFNLSDITPNFLKEYKEYCKRLGNTTNTQWKSFKFLRLIVRKALRENLIEENPFDIFQMPKYKDPEKQYLTEDQMMKLEKIDNLPEEIKFVRDWFIIGCYTGLRFGDMQAFDKKKHIRNGRLVLYTSKNGEVVSLPFTNRIKDLFEKVQYKPVTVTNVHFNRLLKQIEAPVPLSAHLSRHSFGTLCLAKGLSLEVTGKLMGHTNLKTTMIYAKLAGPRIDSEYGRLFD